MSPGQLGGQEMALHRRGRSRAARHVNYFGDLNYPPAFHHFDYVNTQPPPRAVSISLNRSGHSQYNQNFLTFNSLNTFILKGR